MKFNISIFLISFLFSTYVFAAELPVGSTHKNNLNSLYGQKINLIIPNGSFKVIDNVHAEYFELTYQEIYLEKMDGDYGGWLYLTIPKKKSTGSMRWRDNLKKCDGVSKKDIIASGVERGGVEVVVCLSKLTDDGYDYAHLEIEARISNGPLSWMYYDYYTEYESINFNLEDFQKKNIIKDIIKGMKKGFKGGDPSLMSSMNQLFNP